VACLTNVDPENTAPEHEEDRCVQYGDTLPASATASVSFPPSAVKFRYVIIRQQQPLSTDNRAICVAEVKVFLRGTYQNHYIAIITVTILMTAQMINGVFYENALIDDENAFE